MAACNYHIDRWRYSCGLRGIGRGRAFGGAYAPKFLQPVSLAVRAHFPKRVAGRSEGHAVFFLDTGAAPVRAINKGVPTTADGRDVVISAAGAARGVVVGVKWTLANVFLARALADLASKDALEVIKHPIDVRAATDGLLSAGFGARADFLGLRFVLAKW
jgi:hypothetical protein